ncbi:CsbD family protein [Streptomyces sp. NPDC055144]
MPTDRQRKNLPASFPGSCLTIEKDHFPAEELIHVAGAGKKLHGKAQETMGKAKQKIGRATGDNELRVKGTGDRVKGKAQQAAGEVEQTVRGGAEETKGKIRKHT